MDINKERLETVEKIINYLKYDRDIDYKLELLAILKSHDEKILQNSADLRVLACAESFKKGWKAGIDAVEEQAGKEFQNELQTNYQKHIHLACERARKDEAEAKGNDSGKSVLEPSASPQPLPANSAKDFCPHCHHIREEPHDYCAKCLKLEAICAIDRTCAELEPIIAKAKKQGALEACDKIIKEIEENATDTVWMNETTTVVEAIQCLKEELEGKA